MKKQLILCYIWFCIIPKGVGCQTKIDACFEYFVDGSFEQLSRVPNHFHDVSSLREWYNPTEAHPNILISPSLIGGTSTGINGIGNTPLPPNGSNNFIGLGIATPSSGMTPKVSYMATNLIRPLEQGVTYEFEFLIGTAGEGFEGGDFIGSIVLLGCDNCSLPINGTDCKEGVVDVLGKRHINLEGGIWFPNKLSIRFTPNTRITKIMIGPGCNSWPWGDSDGVYYILLDDLCIKKAINEPRPTINNGILNKSTTHSNKIKHIKQ